MMLGKIGTQIVRYIGTWTKWNRILRILSKLFSYAPPRENGNRGWTEIIFRQVTPTCRYLVSFESSYMRGQSFIFNNAWKGFIILDKITFIFFYINKS